MLISHDFLAEIHRKYPHSLSKIVKFSGCFAAFHLNLPPGANSIPKAIATSVQQSSVPPSLLYFAFYLTPVVQQRTIVKLQQKRQQSLRYNKTDWHEGQNLSSLDSLALTVYPSLLPLLSFIPISFHWLSLSFEAVSRKQKLHQHRWDVFICACQTAGHGMWVWQVGHFQTNRGYSARLALKKCVRES